MGGQTYLHFHNTLNYQSNLTNKEEKPTNHSSCLRQIDKNHQEEILTR